jgi:hypothetical protein
MTHPYSRDYQRSRVYDWCRWVLFEHYKRFSVIRSDDYCSRVVSRCCAMYGVPMCDVKYNTHGRQRAAYYHYPFGDEPGFIALPPHMCRIDVAVHEAAHHIVHYLYPGVSPHGPEFMRVFMCLLNRLYRVNLNSMYERALEYGVSYADVSFNAPVISSV